MHMGYIKSLECSTDVIHLLGFPAFIKFCLLLSKFRIQRDVYKFSRCSPNSNCHLLSWISAGLDFYAVFRYLCLTKSIVRCHFQLHPLETTELKTNSFLGLSQLYFYFF